MRKAPVTGLSFFFFGGAMLPVFYFVALGVHGRLAMSSVFARWEDGQASIVA
jgi:hypothetical protein